MLSGVDESRTGINWRSALVAALAGTAVLGATSVGQAHDDDRWKRKRHHHAPYYVAVPPAPVYYAPPVVYAAPPPVVVYPQPVAPAYPVYYGPPGGSMSFGLTVPLR